MLALCLMLLGTYYAQNYTGIIGWCLTIVYVLGTVTALLNIPQAFTWVQEKILYS